MTIQRVIFGLTALLAAATTQAAAVPYNNTFSSTSDALPSATSNWSVTGGNYVNSYQAPTTGNVTTYGTASDSFSDMTSATSFTISTKFSYSKLAATPSASGDTVGLGLFGGDTTFSTNYYLADWNIAGSGVGSLRLLAIGDTSGVTPVAGSTATNTPTGGFAANTTYELRITGTRAGGTLTLTLGAYDAGGNQIGSSVSISDTSPLTGTNFGFRNRYNSTSAGGQTSVGFDNLTIAVPEPASAAAIFGTALLLRRRRRTV